MIEFNEGWSPWESRSSISGLNLPGVYTLAAGFDRSLQDPPSPELLPEDIFYIGVTSKPGNTLAKRLANFAFSAFTGKPRHSGGRAYYAKRLPFGPSEWLVACAPAPTLDAAETDQIIRQLGGGEAEIIAQNWSSLRYGSQLLALESNLLHQYRAKFGRLPHCNTRLPKPPTP